jgi:molybdopterin converting factor small subunit
MENLISHLQERFGEDFKVNIWDKKDPNEFHQRLSIIVNGRTFRDEKFLSRKLKDGDKIWFTHYFFGG